MKLSAPKYHRFTELPKHLRSRVDAYADAGMLPVPLPRMMLASVIATDTACCAMHDVTPELVIDVERMLANF